jgi:hypothetical protein
MKPAGCEANCAHHRPVRLGWARRHGLWGWAAPGVCVSDGIGLKTRDDKESTADDAQERRLSAALTTLNGPQRPSNTDSSAWGAAFGVPAEKQGRRLKNYPPLRVRLTVVAEAEADLDRLFDFVAERGLQRDGGDLSLAERALRAIRSGVATLKSSPSAPSWKTTAAELVAAPARRDARHQCRRLRPRGGVRTCTTGSTASHCQRLQMSLPARCPSGPYWPYSTGSRRALFRCTHARLCPAGWPA